MRKTILVLSTGLFLLLMQPVSAETAPITLDGDISDWDDAGIESLITDTTGEVVGTDWCYNNATSQWEEKAEKDCGSLFVNQELFLDIGDFRMTHDSTLMYVALESAAPIMGVKVLDPTSLDYGKYLPFGYPLDWDGSGPPEKFIAGAPRAFDHSMVICFDLNQDGIDDLFARTNFQWEEGMVGTETGEGMTIMHYLYQDDGDGEYTPSTDTLLEEEEDNPVGVSSDSFDASEGLSAVTEVSDELESFELLIGETVNVHVEMWSSLADETEPVEYTFTEYIPEKITGLKINDPLPHRLSYVNLTWDADDSAATYDIQLLKKNGTVSQSLTSATNSKKIKKKYLVANSARKVKVRGVTGAGTPGEYSDTKTFYVPPAMPRNLQAKRVGPTTAVLDWVAPKRHAKLKHYRVILYKGKKAVRRLNVKKTQKLVRNLDPSSKYSFKVRTVRRTGVSSRWSKKKSFTTMGPVQYVKIEDMTRVADDDLKPGADIDALVLNQEDGTKYYADMIPDRYIPISSGDDDPAEMLGMPDYSVDTDWGYTSLGGVGGYAVIKLEQAMDKDSKNLVIRELRTVSKVGDAYKVYFSESELGPWTFIGRHSGRAIIGL